MWMNLMQPTTGTAIEARPYRVLICDDQPDVLEALRLLLKGPGWQRKSELEIAANVQQKLFPRKLRRLESLDYAGHCMPAREVGGDYYDFLEMPDSTIGFVLGDVSGKGVPAALLMANLQACFRSQAPHSLERPAEVLATVNRHFFDSTAAERFATLVFAAYDDRTRKVRYVNCAHCPPLLLRSGGEVEQLDSTATMLGAFEHWSCAGCREDLTERRRTAFRETETSRG